VIYLDASVLLSIVLLDANSERAGRWWDSIEESTVVSDLANLEVCAVVTREYRAQRFSRSVAEGALADFDSIRAASERLTPDAQDFGFADRLVRDLATKLAAADALHLATAKNAGATLATFDTRLAEAARMQGVGVVEFK
jgi:uncharacterized protein